MSRDDRTKAPPRGKVWLVGAGPGDPELMTLKAVRALEGADAILVDDLVNRAVLAHARPGARVIAVGKRGGCVSTPQAFIERYLVAAATRGERVVRLKGGDPFLFGRGGEECAALRAHGIDVEVVPGVTAGMAGPASIGIPVTDRRAAQGVAFVTGHCAGERAPDWRALAASGLTLVIYMGVARIRQIVDALTSGGLAGATPVAVVESATLPAQRHAVCTLSTLAETARAMTLASPAVLVVGDTVALAAIDLRAAIPPAGTDSLLPSSMG